MANFPEISLPYNRLGEKFDVWKKRLVMPIQKKERKRRHDQTGKN
jgi:hypothetical protein